MSLHIAETTVDALGRVVLEHLPFQPGDEVEVSVRSRANPQIEPADLRGSVLRYENPFDPVAADDWEIQPLGMVDIERRAPAAPAQGSSQ
jgi:hypothetical protein